MEFQRDEIRRKILAPFYESLTNVNKVSILEHITSWTENTPFGEMEAAIKCTLRCLEKVSEMQVSLAIE